MTGPLALTTSLPHTLPAAALRAAENPHAPWNSHDTRVLLVALLGIAVVVVLIVGLKLHAFLALTIGSLVVGLGSGEALAKVSTSYQNGVGGVLGYVGVLIALGAMLGKLLADSGGADEVVRTLLRGRSATLPWKMALIAGIIGIPLFFEIGLVMLIPVVMLAVRRSGRPSMLLGIPALAGLSVLHGFVPPHPGPLAAIGILKANVGVTLALGLLVAVPTVIVCGPLFARLAARWVPVGAAGAALAVTGAPVAVGAGARAGTVTGGPADDDLRARRATDVPGDRGADRATDGTTDRVDGLDDASARAQDPDATGTPSFAWTLATVLAPVVLMLARAAAQLWMDKKNVAYPVLQFVGDPIVALLLSVLLAMVTFGAAVGFTGPVLSRKLGESLLPIVGVLLIVGAGGGFKQVLVDGGTGLAIAKIAVATSLSALLLGWMVAVLIRLATGSATVATVTAAGIVAPLTAGLSSTHLSLVVLAVGAGSLFLSHVNDAGFWLVKEYFGLTVGQTLRTWSAMETLISVVGLVLVWLLSLVL